MEGSIRMMRWRKKLDERISLRLNDEWIGSCVIVLETYVVAYEICYPDVIYDVLWYDMSA